MTQLTFFVALPAIHHYRKAAKRVGVSQASLNQQIIRLEAAPGVDLAERGQRGAVISAGGREVLAQARKMLEETAVLRALAKDARDGISGTIQLGSTPTLGPYFLPFVMRRPHQAYPSLKVVARDAAAVVLQEELLQGRHDLIVTQLPVRSADVQIMLLFREPLKLAVAPDRPLAGRAEARDTDLAGQGILGMSSNYVLHERTVALCKELGANLRQADEGTSLDALRRMTALDMGVSLLPALCVRSDVWPETGDVAVLSFRKDRFTRSVGLSWRRRSAHGKVIDRSADIVRAVAEEWFKGLVTMET